MVRFIPASCFQTAQQGSDSGDFQSEWQYPVTHLLIQSTEDRIYLVLMTVPSPLKHTVEMSSHWGLSAFETNAAPIHRDLGLSLQPDTVHQNSLLASVPMD